MKLGTEAALAVAAKKISGDAGQQRLYNTLGRVLKSLCAEAPQSLPVYHPKPGHHEAEILAKSRALLHLYLKARFGLVSFEDRERYITDDPQDGGIDAFYIDESSKKIHILQAKFRANAKNFSEVGITPGELLKMDVKRVTSGEKNDETGVPYNQKITKNLQKALRGLTDIGRYDYKVVILGNTNKLTQSALKKLIDGFDVEEFHHERIYNELLFPVINGTYFSEPNLTIELNLTNSGQTHLDYDVKARNQKINIKLLFVPTSEVGRVSSKYKNSILKYNPRSFLELSQNSVNKEIQSSIDNNSGNEFSLFNNGVTIISDQTSVNSNTAKINKGQIVLKNPQLINGGQTAFTLGRIYERCEKENDFSVFKGKEVLLRVISFVGRQTPTNITDRLELIGEVSKASNSQTKVDEADRRSNDEIQLKIQKHFFEVYGLYYERKKGEFSDGLHSGYIDNHLLVDRDRLIRVCLAADYRVAQARSSISKFYKSSEELEELFKLAGVEKYAYGYQVSQFVEYSRKAKPKTAGDRYHTKQYGQGLRYGQYAILAAAINSGQPNAVTPEQALNMIMSDWKKFEEWAESRTSNKAYKIGKAFDFANYYKGSTVGADLKIYKFKVK
ncbi:AIPR protein [Rugamonas sp. FT82W]|uniref:AIPR protein n=1 Tax=Duganella vulcania TaxID=2692166 RepID=A0A845G7S8_9BURK|nr:AIPR family protein [Duganella vulcania]MYM90753.1 AIPR protein [Duganella vulcania]